MGRPSISKASKTKTTAVRSEPKQPFPVEFIELLASLPEGSADGSSSDVNDDGDEPPQKRPRVEACHTVTVAKSSLTLKRRKHTASKPSASTFRRHKIERFLKLQVDMLVDGSRNVVKTLVFSTATRCEYGKYKVELVIGNIGILPPDLITILDISNRSRDDSSHDGAVYLSMNVSLDELENEHRMILDFSLKWNESNNVYQGLRSPQQRKITKDVQKAFFARSTDLASHAGVQSSQVFYETAFMTDESYTDMSSIVVPGLATSLYPFQRRALQWSLAREGVRVNRRQITSDDSLVSTLSEPELETSLPMTFRSIKDADGQSIYHSDLYHVVTRSVEPWRELEFTLRGGILAEEMGLGKTVETISLILFHRRPPVAHSIFDAYTNQDVSTTGATLIVTPETLKRQWIFEVERHAPALRIMVYEGRSKYQESEEELIQQMIDSDVVVTTYNVLRAEVHFARPEPERSRRHERTHARASSPLVKLSWWRVCLDEAQQIESGVSAAAEVARLIPRVNAWGITGTPVKEKIKDLWGLLLFLRYEPFASYPIIWDTLIASHRDSFKQLFNKLALRHTKHAVRSELVLPPQRRYVITMPFTAVEEQNYRSRFKQEVESLGLDVNGVPLNPADWDASTPSTIDRMRRALASLRQTVLHPQLGPEKARALGGTVNKALRTIEEVLDAMIEQTDTVIKTHQRSYLVAKLKRGQLLENSPRVREALAIWKEALLEIEALETECRAQLLAEIETSGVATAHSQQAINDEGYIEDDSDEENVPPRLGEARRRLRSALDLKHRAVFFIASAYFQIKSNEEITQPDSDEFRRLEELEVEGYKNANSIRQEILQETHNKASLYMREISKKAKKQSFVEIPEFTGPDKSGLESRRHVEEYIHLIGVMDEQANLVDQLREHVIQLLLKPLVDQEEDEITGEEYENSTKIQNDLMVYTTILRATISDRQESLSGLANERIKHEMKFYERQAKQDEGPSPETFLELLRLRDQSKSSEFQGSLRAVIANMREFATKLQGDASERSGVELRIVRDLQKLAQEDIAKQTKANADLEKELNFFTSAMNARVEYYRQLQAVSDTVATWDRDDHDNDENLMLGLLDEEAKSQQKMESAISTQRYQVHLKDQGQKTDTKICPICTEAYTVGILTPCTHEFCKNCIKTWVAAHHRCPLCKKPVAMRNCHDITIREPKLKLRNDQDPTAPDNMQSSEGLHKTTAQGIYTNFGEDKLKEINDVPLEGHPLPTKVNALVRHLLWLRKQDAGAKSVIFSQFGAFLDILKQALYRQDIGFSSFATKNGITRFKEDPAIECFLMDARAHASGLNLVNANHVFLCEPLLNTALELQAIARVDRIGQSHETNVWLYLVEGTVEESIYNLSIKRRLDHMVANTKGKEAESAASAISEDKLEVANSLELQQANLPKLMDKDARLGEVVDKNDLWDCLFGHLAKEDEAQRTAMSSDARFENQAVRGFLAGRAAEERRDAQTRYHEEQELQEALETAVDEVDLSSEESDDDTHIGEEFVL
ncbi:SNF2 family N-terminal domain-containing protein [Pestalotiopsis sp. NC0098]|nr:SNF2 family N-terminal domain-containing protein [Pestalotiopsis sp. NC0098]